ncbi:MAG: DUF5343 domain-containing protein, partial [Pseudonocardiaceae bacterium]
MVTQDAKHAGYAPGKTVIGLIERFRNVGLPSPLTIKSIQRVNVSESLASRTVKTFQILGLIDQQGMPTQQFEKLRRASTAEFKPELIALLKSVYADVFEVVEPAGATLAEIQDAFRPFTPPGQRIRMVSLFLNLLEYAEYSDSLPSVRGSGGTSPAEGRLKQQSRTNRNGKADSRLDGGVQTALATWRGDLARAHRAARAVAREPVLQAALRSASGIETAALSAAHAAGARSLLIRGPGQAATRVGPPGVAVARVTVTQPGGAPLATILASTTTARGYVAQVHRLTGLDVAVVGPGGRVAGTMPVQAGSLPASGHSGDVEISGSKMRATTAQLPGAGGFEVAMAGPVSSGGFLSSTPAVAAALAVFLVIALLKSVYADV